VCGYRARICAQCIFVVDVNSGVLPTRCSKSDFTAPSGSPLPSSNLFCPRQSFSILIDQRAKMPGAISIFTSTPGRVRKKKKRKTRLFGLGVPPKKAWRAARKRFARQLLNTGWIRIIQPLKISVMLGAVLLSVWWSELGVAPGRWPVRGMIVNKTAALPKARRVKRSRKDRVVACFHRQPSSTRHNRDNMAGRGLPAWPAASPKRRASSCASLLLPAPAAARLTRSTKRDEVASTTRTLRIWRGARFA